MVASSFAINRTVGLKHMRTASAATADCANLSTEPEFGGQDLAVRALGAVVQKLHARFKAEKAKPIAHIAARAHVGTRAVEEWHGGRALMSGEALVSLILSDIGEEVLDAILKAAPPRERPMWARRYLNTIQLVQIEKLQAEQDENIKQLRLSLLK